MSKRQIITLSILSIIFITTNILFYKIAKDDNIKYQKSLIEIDDMIHTYMEKAYFEGQKDAIEGDIRIQKVGNHYKWTKSCWDNSDRVVKFDPENDTLK